jgi:hypothetical protein
LTADGSEKDRKRTASRREAGDERREAVREEEHTVRAREENAAGLLDRNLGPAYRCYN